jgi:DNA polymerase-3 subunit delta'
MSTHAWLNLPKQIASGVSLAQLPAAVVDAPLSLATTLQKICHDTLCHAQGAKPRYFSSESLPTAPNGPLAVQASVYKLTGWTKSLTASMRVIEHPVKPDLMMEAMLAEAKLALQSKESI